MTANRTDSASPVHAASEGWELWLAILEQVFPRGMRWPWATEEDQRGALQIAAQEFQCDTMAARTARRFTLGVLSGWSMSQIADDAALAVCELVTNAVRHGLSGPSISHSPARLLIFRSHRALLCVVTDPSDAPPVLQEPDRTLESGRGLQVVAGVSRMWGWTRLYPAGKAVWAGFTAARTDGIPMRPLRFSF